MVKSLGMVAAVGIVGLVLTKLLWMLMLPIVGIFIGFMVIAFKVLLVIGLVWLAFSLFRKFTDRPSEA